MRTPLFRLLAIALFCMAPASGFAEATDTAPPSRRMAELSGGSVHDDGGSLALGGLRPGTGPVALVPAREAVFRWQAPAPARRDSIWNGAIVGGLIGASLGVLTWGFADCPGDDPGGPCPAARTAGFLLSTAAFAGIGAGIDALLDEHGVLPRRPAGSPPARAHTGRRLGVRVALRW